MQHWLQKCKCHSLIRGNSFPNFEEWIANIINDEKEEGKDITTKESELSQSPHIWATWFGGMWAYGSHLRVEEKDKEKIYCDCVVSAEFFHDIEKKVYVGFF